MSIQVKGKIQAVDMGPGAWALVADNGEQYQLHQPAPSQLLQSGLKVNVTGKIRDDVMTFAMTGAVLEVEEYEILS